MEKIYDQFGTLVYSSRFAMTAMLSVGRKHCNYIHSNIRNIR